MAWLSAFHSCERIASSVRVDSTSTEHGLRAMTRKAE